MINKPPPLYNTDYDRDPVIKAVKKKGFIIACLHIEPYSRYLGNRSHRVCFPELQGNRESEQIGGLPVLVRFRLLLELSELTGLGFRI